MRTNCGHGEQNKNAKYFIIKYLAFEIRTQSRDRTGMEVNPLVFETSASTNSAIWAFDLFSNAWQRYGFFLNAQTFDYFFLNIIQRQIKSQIIYLALYLFEYIKST